MNFPKLYRRKRYKDVINVGPSSIVPYIENESWNERHKRRMILALGHVKEIESWCIEHKWGIEIKNNGHHWLFTKEKIVEWWPSSGKLIIKKDWKKGIHCHDWVQLLKILKTKGK